MKYEPSLDGVRAISVLLVMAYHFDLNAWGHVGVDIFFVLSGFLITTILIRQRHQELGHYLLVFYERRTLRIFPLYYGYLLVLAIGFLAIGRPLGFDTNWPYLFTYTVNFAHLDPDWFPSAFYGHLWSLSVEEQFYLLWPLLIYFLSPKASKVLMLVLLVACPLIRVAGGMLLSDVAPTIDALGSLPPLQAIEAFDNLPVSCWDAFAAGALIHVAGLRAKSRTFWFWYVGILAAATVALGASLLSARGVGTDYAPAELMTAVLDDRAIGFSLRNLWIVCIVTAALEWSPLRNALSMRPLVLVGRISYGVYVFHWPIMIPFRRMLAYEPLSPEGLLVFALYSATVIGVAYVSYRWFETWFQRWKLPYAEPAARSLDDSMES
jgi:peptidoglycan/LPS O-acetylase OafA/YrhL